MKIIKPGRQQVGWSIQKTCTGNGNGNGGCGAILLVEQGDLFITSSHCRDETNDYITFCCVSCGSLTDLADQEKPPQTIQSQLLSHAEWAYARAMRIEETDTK